MARTASMKPGGTIFGCVLDADVFGLGSQRDSYHVSVDHSFLQ